MLTSDSDFSATEEDDIPSSPPGRWITGVTADMPLLDALEVVFTQRFQAVLHYLPLAAERSVGNMGFVHKLRVSCRRLAAVLDILAAELPDAPRKTVLKLINGIRKSCGRARDLDVRRKHLESLVKMASVEEVAVLELLCRSIVRQRKKTQRQLRRKLPRLQKEFTRAGEEMLGSLRKLQQSAADGSDSFGQTGCRILTRELAALWETASQEPDSTQRLHQLRIACKHLRYAAEVFMPALPDLFREDFYPQLENIQELLGEFHDAAEATISFKRLKKKWKSWKGTKKWSRHGLDDFHWRELKSGLDSVLLAYAQQSDHARTEFLDLWPGFAGGSFREPVAELLAEQVAPGSAPPVDEHQSPHITPDIPGHVSGDNDERLLPH